MVGAPYLPGILNALKYFLSLNFIIACFYPPFVGWGNWEQEKVGDLMKNVALEIFCLQTEKKSLLSYELRILILIPLLLWQIRKEVRHICKLSFRISPILMILRNCQHLFCLELELHGAHLFSTSKWRFRAITSNQNEKSLKNTYS